MFKKIVIALLLALPMSLFAQKFGVVDIEAVLSAMPETKAMQTQLTDTSKKYEDEFQKLQEEVNKLYADFQNIQNDTETPQSIKERRMQEIQELDQKMQQFRATVSQDLSRQQETLMAPIQEKVRQAINTVGKENSMTFIFENILPVYTGTDVQDVTAKVKAKLGLQ